MIPGPKIFAVILSSRTQGWGDVGGWEKRTVGWEKSEDPCTVSL